MKNLVDLFTAEFKHRLTAHHYDSKTFNRWPAFKFIAKELLAKEKPHIVETGTLNSQHDWLGYGQATMLWDWIAGKKKSQVLSIDINRQACKTAQSLCKHVGVIESDSIAFLRTYYRVHEIDLLYLDSYNWSEEEHAVSSLHHIGELAAVYEKLKPGCLIAVDDCHSSVKGKHVLVHHFFKELLGQEPEVSCAVEVWRKR